MPYCTNLSHVYFILTNTTTAAMGPRPVLVVCSLNMGNTCIHIEIRIKHSTIDQMVLLFQL